jgi:hypothetical protein
VGNAGGEGGFESVIDDLLGAGDLGSLFGGEGAVPAEHAGFKRAAVVKGKHVEGLGEAAWGHGDLRKSREQRLGTSSQFNEFS